MAATLTKEQILDGIAELSVIELSELLKEFEEKFAPEIADAEVELTRLSALLGKIGL